MALFGMANNGVIIPAQRDGALYNFLLGGQDYVFDGIGDEFEITPSGSSFVITLGEGEGVVCGRHVTEETSNGTNSMITLSANASGYIVIRVDLTQVPGSEAYLAAVTTLRSDDLNNGGEVHDLPLYQYATNGSGVSSFTDIRNISAGQNVVCQLENGNLYVYKYSNGTVTKKQVGSLDPATLTAAPADVKSGKTFGGSGSDAAQTGTFAAQTKTATPTNAAQTISPDAGKYLSGVTVKGIGVKANTNTASYVHTGTVIVDLGATKTVKLISFGGVTNGGTFTLQPSYSTNGSNYTNIGSAVSGNPTGTVKAVNISARYIKVTYDGHDGISNSLWCSVVYIL